MLGLDGEHRRAIAGITGGCVQLQLAGVLAILSKNRARKKIVAAEITVVVGVFVSPSSTTCFATAVIATTTAGGTGRSCIDHSAGSREHLDFTLKKESRKTAMQPQKCMVAFRLHVKDTTLNLPPMGPTPSWQWSGCLMLLGDLPMVYIIL